LWRTRRIFDDMEGAPKVPGRGVIQAHDWPWQWHGRQSAVDAACRQALWRRRCGQWSPYAQMTAPCRRILGIPTPVRSAFVLSLCLETAAWGNGAAVPALGILLVESNL